MIDIYLEFLQTILKFLPLAFFSLIFLQQIYSKEFFKLLKLFFIFYIILIFVNSLFLTLFQYLAFTSSPISRHLLPPETSLNYFLGYSYQHFIKEPLWRSIGALTALTSLFVLNKIFKERFFYKEEPLLVACGFASLVWPRGFLFVFLALAFGLLIHFIRLLFFEYNKERRLSFFYLWIPVWIVVWTPKIGEWLMYITNITNLSI